MGLMNLKLAAVLSIVVLVVCLVPSFAASPNLVIIHTDEHHFNTLGCYGGEVVETPHIDWLAERGALCTSFYATTPVCSPSRAAFVSGRYPQCTPVVTNNIPLADDVVTFASILGKAGYATGYAGKWHLDGGGKPQWGPERQFGFAENQFMFNRGHWKKFEDAAEGPRVAARNEKGVPSYAVDGADDKSFATDWLADKAVDFIERQQGGPFCYMVSLPDPHGPNTVRAPYDTMYNGVEVPIPATLERSADQIPGWGESQKGVSAESLRRIMPPYYGMVKCIDDNVGKILDCLRKEKLLDNTIVVFTADHGDECGEHGRLNKGVPYEGSAKIPFVVYYPAKVPAGTVVDEALSCIDFLPTMLEMMEVETAGTEQGRDASALITGKGVADWHDIAFLRGTGGANWVCAVTDRYKLVYSPKSEPWLFDLEKDPLEVTNCFGEAAYGPIVEQLTAELIEYCEAYDPANGEDPTIKAAMAAAVGG
jgi:arylsulfatase A-like enzyme